MKTFRNAVMDAEVLSEILTWISDTIDEAINEKVRLHTMGEDNVSACDDGDYYFEQAARQEAKAAAYERLLSKLSK